MVINFEMKCKVFLDRGEFLSWLHFYRPFKGEGEPTENRFCPILFSLLSRFNKQTGLTTNMFV